MGSDSGSLFLRAIALRIDRIGDGLRSFALVEQRSKSLQHRLIRPISDWWSSRRRSKSCQPDTGQRRFRRNSEPPFLIPVWVCTATRTVTRGCVRAAQIRCPHCRVSSRCCRASGSAWRMVSRVRIAGMVPGLEIAGRDWLSGRTLGGRRWDHTLCAMLNDLRGRERHTPRAMPR